MRTLRALAALSFALGLGAACAPAESDPVITASASPSQVAPGGTTTLSVEVDNFELVDPATHTDVVEGEGHYHVYLDEVAGTDALAIEHRNSVDVTIPSDVTGTIHRLIISLRNSDHSERDPIARKEVIIEVIQP
jgi:hypothetical protein